jgi:DNA polymerase-4
VVWCSIGDVRSAPTILHLDMDAFYASAEQAAKPSLRGKAVVVGGLGPRGVVATASYEARVFGVHSAMPMGQARRLAPHAAYLVPRFGFYRAISDQVMGLLRALSPLVEPLSLDEAFVDLEAGGVAWDEESARLAGVKLRADIKAVTGLTGSVGLAASKMLAKIGSEQAKPDGLVMIRPGTERALLGPMSVRTLPGVGPATGDHLRRGGITTVEEIAEAGEAELIRLLGKAHGQSLYAMALARDERPVVAERDTKSVSVEDTYDVDIHDRVRVRTEVTRLAERCVRRLREAGLSGRTIVLKVRRYDFSTLTRSETLRGPTDDPAVVREAAGRLLESVDTTGGVRLLGVGVSGLADYTQEDLFAQAHLEAGGTAAPPEETGRDAGPGEPGGAPPGADDDAVRGEPAGAAERHWRPGQDVTHAELGPGWVQGSGLGRVTVRFETPQSAPGRVRTFRAEDADLQPADPLPLISAPGPGYAGPPRRIPAANPGAPGPGTDPQGSGVGAREHGVDAQGPGVKVQDYDIEPQGPGVEAQDHDTEARKRGVDAQGPGTEPPGPDTELRKRDTEPQEPGVEPQEPGVEPHGSGGVMRAGVAQPSRSDAEAGGGVAGAGPGPGAAEAGGSGADVHTGVGEAHGPGSGTGGGSPGARTGGGAVEPRGSGVVVRGGAVELPGSGADVRGGATGAGADASRADRRPRRGRKAQDASSVPASSSAGAGRAPSAPSPTSAPSLPPATRPNEWSGAGGGAAASSP